MAFTENNAGGLVYMTADNISARHAFTTRYGGVSAGVFESLNLSASRGDDKGAVAENYRRLASALGVSVGDFAFSNQVHKADVRVVTARDRHELFTEVPYEADALVTGEKGVALMIFIADCVPVLMHDAAGNVAAAVHCGWRSSVMDILGKTVRIMGELGAAPENIQAAVGPAIGHCCFETGPEVPEAIERYLSGDTRGLFTPEHGVPGKFMTDLKQANKRRLVQLGVRDEHIRVSPECTRCNMGKYWSHRGTNGQRGSQAGVIVL